MSVVAIESSLQRDLALKFIKKEKLSFHLLENLRGDREVVRKLFNVSGYPTTLIIDGRGRVLFAHLGFRTGDEAKLEAEIIELFNRK